MALQCKEGVKSWYFLIRGEWPNFVPREMRQGFVLFSSIVISLEAVNRDFLKYFSVK